MDNMTKTETVSTKAVLDYKVDSQWYSVTCASREDAEAKLTNCRANGLKVVAFFVSDEAVSA